MSITKAQAREVVLDTLQEVLDAAGEAFEASRWSLTPAGALNAGLHAVRARVVPVPDEAE